MRKSDFFISQISNIRGLTKAELVSRKCQKQFLFSFMILAVGDGLSIQRVQLFYSSCLGQGNAATLPAVTCNTTK
jgi:hypothetical protein